MKIVPTVNECLEAGVCKTCLAYFPHITPPWSTHCRATASGFLPSGCYKKGAWRIVEQYKQDHRPGRRPPSAAEMGI